MIEKPQNPLQKGEELDRRGLEWVWDFGWLRPQELGRLLWPKVGHATKNAERICRKWEANGLILRRKLPNHNGTAIVLSSKGAELLSEIEINAKTGKDIGSVDGNEWTPPATWKHDLLSAGVLSIFHEMGHEIYPEMKLRRKNQNTNKIPDGIIKWKHEGKFTHRIWLEVEASRKTGAKYGDTLAKAVIDSMNEKGEELSEIRCNYAMIAINPNQLCERGYSLSHKKIIKNKIEKLTPKDIKICFLELELTGIGVSKFTITHETVESNKIARAVGSLDKKWEKKLKNDRTKGREMEFYSDVIRGLHKAEYWKENEKWFLEYTDPRKMDDGRIKNEFETLTALKRYAARVHLNYEAAAEAAREARAIQSR